MVQVNWKAAATIVTGATALAGWLSAPSTLQTPAQPQAVASQQRRPTERDTLIATHAATIEKEALRLAARLRRADAFAEGSRDPFHFAAPKPVPARAAARRVPSTAAAPALATVEPPPLPFRLSGIATDDVDGKPARTAVLSGGDTGLVLAVAGDVVGGVYRVDRIEATGVDFTDTRDGRVVRLTFAAP